MRFRLALALIAAAAAICDVEPAAAQYGQYAVPFAFGGVIGQMQQLQQQQYMLQQQQNLARQQAGAAWSQQPPNQTWYYCDTARAYYPYVATCSVPWRPVGPQPQPYAAEPYWSPPSQQVYQQGLQQQQQEAARQRQQEEADRQRYVGAGAPPHTVGEYAKVLQSCYDQDRDHLKEFDKNADAAGIPRLNPDQFYRHCPHSAQIAVDCHLDIDCIYIEVWAEQYVKEHGRTFVTPADRAIVACVLHRIDANPKEPWLDRRQACGSG